MKIGIYGGTFNPPHLGHYEAARGAIEALGLDKLILVPAATPPHKKMPEGSALQGDRLEMTQQMATALGLPQVVEVSTMEMERAGESYTVDTLRALRDQYPQGELWLLMGSDMFLTLHRWRDPEGILKLANVCTFSRTEGEGAQALVEQKAQLEANFGATATIITLPHLVEVSSTQLREELAQGQGGDRLLPQVYGHILMHGLYDTGRDLTGLGVEALRGCAFSMMRPKRIPHVLGVEQTAVQLARYWGADEEQARRAAILHDCTKYWSVQQHLELCDQYGFPLDELERNTEKLLHAKSGACMARHVFGETDQVQAAISWHTTARGEMTTLEKIVYLADYMEPNRDFDGVEELRRLVFIDLDVALLLGVEMTIEDMEAGGLPIHPKTRETRDWLLHKKSQRED